MSGLTVRVDASTPGESAAVSPVGFSGDFTLTGVQPGMHLLHVIDLQGNEIATSMVTVGSGNLPITIELPHMSQERPTGETVTVEQLQHKPPKEARKAAQKAQHLSEKKQYAKAAKQLEKAVAADPEYGAAYNNLGVQYLRLGRAPESVAAFRRGVELDPANARAQVNLAVALMQVGKFKEAENWVRRSIHLDRDIPAAHYVLGTILAHKGDVMAATQELTRVADRLPAAQQALAMLRNSMARARPEPGRKATRAWERVTGKSQNAGKSTPAATNCRSMD